MLKILRKFFVLLLVFSTIIVVMGCEDAIPTQNPQKHTRFVAVSYDELNSANSVFVLRDNTTATCYAIYRSLNGGNGGNSSTSLGQVKCE